jgi:hypothetical protein
MILKLNVFGFRDGTVMDIDKSLGKKSGRIEAKTSETQEIIYICFLLYSTNKMYIKCIRTP